MADAAVAVLARRGLVGVGGLVPVGGLVRVLVRVRVVVPVRVPVRASVRRGRGRVRRLRLDATPRDVDGAAARRTASSRRSPRSRWPPRPVPRERRRPARARPAPRRRAPPGRGSRRVCDTLTDSPSPTAWSGVPRVPTRYAAISVLPCPGVRAWPAPSAAAVSNDTSRTTGVRSVVAEDRWQVAGPDAARHAGNGHWARDRGRRGRPRRRHPSPAPSSGLASAMSNGGSVGPPSVATTDIEACRRAAA